MLNPIKLLKQMKSTQGLDEALELLASLGIQVELTPIPLEQRPAEAELQQIATLAVAEGAKFFRLTAEQGGNPLYAFLVIGKKAPL